MQIMNNTDNTGIVTAGEHDALGYVEPGSFFGMQAEAVCWVQSVSSNFGLQRLLLTMKNFIPSEVGLVTWRSGVQVIVPKFKSRCVSDVSNSMAHWCCSEMSCEIQRRFFTYSKAEDAQRTE